MPGESVTKGQTIAILDDTRFKSTYSETLSKLNLCSPESRGFKLN